MNERPQFKNYMYKYERVTGFIYLPIHIFVLPLAIALFFWVFPSNLSELAVNAIYFGIGALTIFIFMHRYLRSGIDIFLEDTGRMCRSVVMGFFANIVLANIINALIIMLFGDITNANNDTVIGIAESYFGPMFALAVIVAPLVEEVLYRGVLFGCLRTRSRILAYAVSILMFSFSHVWQFLLIDFDIMNFVPMLQYFPAAFVLAWLYERTETIFAPMLLHMAINALGLLASRA